MEQNDLQRALMAVLFAAGEPVDAKRLSQTLEHDEAEIHEACKTLMDELSFNRSGIRIVRLENAYQMCSSPEMAEYVTKTLETRKPPKLSPSQLETLTVIAYYQPATKALVEQIRGVDSTYCRRLKRSTCTSIPRRSSHWSRSRRSPRSRMHQRLCSRRSRYDLDMVDDASCDFCCSCADRLHSRRR